MVMKFLAGLYLITIGYTSEMGNYLVAEMHGLLCYMGSCMGVRCRCMSMHDPSHLKFYHMGTWMKRILNGSWI